MKKNGLFAAIAVLLVLAGIAFTSSGKKSLETLKKSATQTVSQTEKALTPTDDNEEQAQPVDAAIPSPQEQTAQTQPEAPVASATEAPPPAAPAESAPAVSIDTQAALEPRGLGDPNAPVRIDEFASLTCSHCADFYNETFPKLKAAYIDTGKVYFVYNDFPLNPPAFDAAMIARCLPKERYFSFIELLFKKQKDWAYENDYKDMVKQDAKLAGMDDATFDSCLADQGLRFGIAEHMKEGGEKHKIRSTPSFIINGEKTLSGSLPLESFEQELTPLLGQAGLSAQPGKTE